MKRNEVKKAFQIIDVNKDGVLCMEDFKNLFNSYDHYGAQQMSEDLWNNILDEADKNGDGKIDYDEFESAMKDVFRKSWLRKCDQSPSRSISPCRRSVSPVKFNFQDCDSPVKKTTTKKQGQIISPERNPFADASVSPERRARGRRTRGGRIDPHTNENLGMGIKLIAMQQEKTPVKCEALKTFTGNQAREFSNIRV